MSQHREILSYLKKGNVITKLDCIKIFHFINLGDIIMVLRNKGYDIKTTMALAPSGRKFAIYSLDAK